ncbi:hypothetical protein ACF0H5_015715 [Mactra antiquata]
MDPGYQGYPPGNSFPGYSPVIRQPTGVRPMYMGVPIYYPPRNMGGNYYNYGVHQTLPNSPDCASVIQSAVFTGSPIYSSHFPVGPNIRCPPPQPHHNVVTPPPFYNTTVSSQHSPVPSLPAPCTHHVEENPSINRSRTPSPKLPQLHFVPPRLRTLVNHYGGQDMMHDLPPPSSSSSLSMGPATVSVATSPVISPASRTSENSEISSPNTVSVTSTEKLSTLTEISNKSDLGNKLLNFNQRQNLIDFYVQKHAYVHSAENASSDLSKLAEMQSNTNTGISETKVVDLWADIENANSINHLREVTEHTSGALRDTCPEPVQIDPVEVDINSYTRANTNDIVNHWVEKTKKYLGNQEEHSTVTEEEINKNQSVISLDNEINSSSKIEENVPGSNSVNPGVETDPLLEDELIELDLDSEDDCNSDIIEDHEFMCTDEEDKGLDLKGRRNHYDEVKEVEKNISEIGDCQVNDETADVVRTNDETNDQRGVINRLSQETGYVVDSMKEQDINCNYQLKKVDLADKDKGEQINVEESATKDSTYKDIAKGIVQQAITRGMSKFFKSLMTLAGTQDEEIANMEKDEDKLVDECERKVNELYSWDVHDVDIKEEDATLVSSTEVDTVANGFNCKEMTITPREKAIDFEDIFFRQTASKHGIVIQSPRKDEFNKSSRKQYQTPSSQVNPLLFEKPHSMPMHVSHQKDSYLFSEDLVNVSNEDSLSDAVDSFKLKASLRGIHIAEDTSDKVTDTDFEVDSVTKQIRSRHTSISEVHSRRVSTPVDSDPSSLAVSPDTSPCKKKKTVFGKLCPNAPEFNPDSINSSFSLSLDGSDVFNMSDSSIRPEAPVFVPESSKAGSKLKVNAAVFEPKKKESKVVHISAPKEKVPNPSVEIQAVPEMTSVSVATKSTRCKDSSTLTSNCDTREVSVNTTLDDLDFEIGSSRSPSPRKKGKSLPDVPNIFTRTIGVNTMKQNDKISSEVYHRSTMTDQDSENEIMKSLLQQCQIDLMKYKQDDFIQTFTKRQNSILEDLRKSWGNESPKLDEVLDNLLQIYYDTMDLYNDTIEKIQSGEIVKELPDLMSKIPDSEAVTKWNNMPSNRVEKEEDYIIEKSNENDNLPNNETVTKEKDDVSEISSQNVNSETKADAVDVDITVQKEEHRTKGLFELEDSSDDDDNNDDDIVDYSENNDKKPNYVIDGKDVAELDHVDDGHLVAEGTKKDIVSEVNIKENVVDGDQEENNEGATVSMHSDIVDVSKQFNSKKSSLDLNNISEYNGPLNGSHSANIGAGDSKHAAKSVHDNDVGAFGDTIGQMMQEEYMKVLNSNESVWSCEDGFDRLVSEGSTVGDGLSNAGMVTERTDNINNNAGTFVSTNSKNVRLTNYTKQKHDLEVTTDKSVNGDYGHGAAVCTSSNPASKDSTSGDNDIYLSTDHQGKHESQVKTEEVYTSPEKKQTVHDSDCVGDNTADLGACKKPDTVSTTDLNLLQTSSMTNNSTDILGVDPMLMMMNNLNPALYQAVLAQLIKAYPELACNHEMLTQVAIQQTCLLQVYMTNQTGSANPMLGPCGSFPTQSMPALGELSNDSNLAENKEVPDLNSFPSLSSSVPTIPSMSSAVSSESIAKPNDLPNIMKDSTKLDRGDTMNEPLNRPPGLHLVDEIGDGDFMKAPSVDCDISGKDNDKNLLDKHGKALVGGNTDSKSSSIQDMSIPCHSKDSEVLHASHAELDRMSLRDKSNSDTCTTKSDDKIGSSSLQPLRLPNNASKKKNKKRSNSGARAKTNIVTNEESVDLIDIKAEGNHTVNTQSKDTDYEVSANGFSGSVPTPEEAFSASMSHSSVSMNSLDQFDITENGYGATSVGMDKTIQNKKTSVDPSTKGHRSAFKDSSEWDENGYLFENKKLNQATICKTTSNSFKSKSQPDGFGFKFEANQYSSENSMSNPQSFTPANLPPRLQRQKSQKDKTPVVLSTSNKFEMPSAASRTFKFAASNQSKSSVVSSTECWDDEVDMYAETFTFKGNSNLDPVFLKPDVPKKKATKQSKRTGAMKTSAKTTLNSMVKKTPHASYKGMSHSMDKEMSSSMLKTSSSSMSQLDDIPLKSPSNHDNLASMDDNNDTSGEWLEVPTRRKRHSSKEQQKAVKKVKTPSPTNNVTVPATTTQSTAATKPVNKSVKQSNFERLVGRIQEEYPHADRQAVLVAIGKIRDSRGTLKGLSMEYIIEQANLYIPKKSRTSINMQVSVKKEKPKTIPGLNLPKRKPQTLNIPKYMPSDIENSTLFDDDEDICAICHDPLRSQPVKQLDCKHLYHSDCISKWVQLERTCPTCRTHALFPEDFPRLGK